MVTAEAARHGLRVVGESTFTGHGQARTPAQVIGDLTAGRYSFEPPPSLLEALGALPGQDVARADPRYRVLAFG